MAPNRIVAPARRDEIIQATIRCLARDGYARFTMKNLAREAGLSQGILHYYFSDKTAILVAALEAVTAEMDQRLTQVQQLYAKTPTQHLHAVIRTCLSTAQDSPEIWQVYMQLWGDMMHNNQLLAVNAALYSRMRRQMAALLTLGIRAGSFRRVDVTQAAAVVVGLMDGLALQLRFDPQALALETAVQCCCDAVDRYLSP